MDEVEAAEIGAVAFFFSCGNDSSTAASAASVGADSLSTCRTENDSLCAGISELIAGDELNDGTLRAPGTGLDGIKLSAMGAKTAGAVVIVPPLMSAGFA